MPIERVATSATLFGTHGKLRGSQLVEVAIDGPRGDAEALGEDIRCDAAATTAKELGDGKESGLAAHRGNLTIR